MEVTPPAAVRVALPRAIVAVIPAEDTLAHGVAIPARVAVVTLAEAIPAVEVAVIPAPTVVDIRAAVREARPPIPVRLRVRVKEAVTHLGIHRVPVNLREVGQALVRLRAATAPVQPAGTAPTTPIPVTRGELPLPTAALSEVMQANREVAHPTTPATTTAIRA